MDRLKAEGTKIKREREKEGDEFENLQSYVTENYKKKQQELEMARKYEENQVSIAPQDFYNNMWERRQGKDDDNTTDENENMPTVSKFENIRDTSRPKRQFNNNNNNNNYNEEINNQIQQSIQNQENQRELKKQKQIEILKSSKIDKSAVQAARERYLARKKE